ncbi:MAG: DNA-binding protein [Anaerolineae bacterium]
MQVKRLGDRYLVRLEMGEQVVERLKQFADAYGVRFASFQAIGTFERVTLGYYNTETQSYQNEELDEAVEVLSMSGNISVAEDGQRIVHAHTVVGRSDYSALGGHVAGATAGPTVEVVVETSATKIIRRHDPETGLHLWDLDSTTMGSA